MKIKIKKFFMQLIKAIERTIKELNSSRNKWCRIHFRYEHLTKEQKQNIKTALIHQEEAAKGIEGELGEQNIPPELFNELCVDGGQYARAVKIEEEYQSSLDLISRSERESKIASDSEKKPDRPVSLNLRDRLMENEYKLEEFEIKRVQIHEIIERNMLEMHENSRKEICLAGQLSIRASEFTLKNSDKQKITKLLSQLDDEERLELLRRLPRHSPILEVVSEEDREAVRVWRENKLPPLLEDVDPLNFEAKHVSSGIDDDDSQDGDARDREEDEYLEDHEYDTTTLLFEGNMWDPALHAFYTSKNMEVFDSLPTLSDETLSTLVIFSFTEASRNSLHARLLRRLCYSAQNCYAIYDALTFILLLEESDWELLYRKQHLLGIFYAKVCDFKEEETDPTKREAKYQSFLKAIATRLIIDYKLFEKLYNTEGNYLSVHGVFSKLEGTHLTATDHTLSLSQIKQDPGTPLAMIKSARKLLDSTTTEMAGIQLQMPTLSLLDSRDGDFEATLPKYSIIGVLAHFCVKSKYLIKEELASLTKLYIEDRWSVFVRPIKSNSPSFTDTKFPKTGEDGFWLDISDSRELLETKRNSIKPERLLARGSKVSAKIVEKFCVDKKSPWPKIDAMLICRNNVTAFEGLVHSMILIGTEVMLELTRLIIEEYPDLYFDAVSAALNTFDQTLLAEGKQMLELFESTKEEFISQSEEGKYDPKKNLYKQDQVLWRKEIKEFIENKAKKNHVFMEEGSLAVYMTARIIGAQLPEVVQKIMQACEYKAPFKEELREIRASNQTREKKGELIAALRLRKRVWKSNCKEHFRQQVLALVDSRKQAVEFCRVFIEYIGDFSDFFGIYPDSQNTIKEIMKGYQKFFVGMLKFGKAFSLLCKRKTETEEPNTKNKKIFDFEYFDAEWLDADNEADGTKMQENLISPLELVRIMSLETNQGPQTSSIQRISSLTRQESRMYSQSAERNLTESAFAGVFDSLFGKTYFWCKHGSAFTKSKHSQEYTQIALYKGKSVPMSEKLAVIKNIVHAHAKKMDREVSTEDIQLQINRATPWNSTLTTYLETLSPAKIAMYRPRINFLTEMGQDADGLTREWLTLISLEVFNPSYGLFALSANKRSIYPAALSFMVPNYLYHFRMLGRFVAKALIENWQFEATFAKSFLKEIIGRPLCIPDLEDIDPELAQSLQKTLDIDVTGLDLEYKQTLTLLGRTATVALIENADSVVVDNSNKKEHVKAVAKANMVDHTYRQIEAFRLGMYELIPEEVLNLLTDNEIGLHLSGMPTIDIDELERNVKYSGSLNKDSVTVKYLFEILREWDQTMLANFLFFYSGSFKVPLEGFERYPLKIDGVRDTERLPVAHTCYNRIDLPDYQNLEMLKEKLELAILQGGSFHIV